MTKEDFINAYVGFKGSKFFLYAAEVDGGMCTVAHGEIEDIVIGALNVIETAAKRKSDRPRYVRYLLYTALILLSKEEMAQEKAPKAAATALSAGQ